MHDSHSINSSSSDTFPNSLFKNEILKSISLSQDKSLKNNFIDNVESEINLDCSYKSLQKDNEGELSNNENALHTINTIKDKKQEELSIVDSNLETKNNDFYESNSVNSNSSILKNNTINN